MTSNEKQACVREAVGVFYQESLLKNAIEELSTKGFQQTEVALLASEQVVEQSLGDFYSGTNAESDTPGAPGIAFVNKEALGETAQSLGGGLSFVLVTFAMGALVLIAALLGGPMFAAIGGVVAVGVVGALVASVSYQSDAEKLKEQVDKGHILLFVKIADRKREKEVMAILKNHSAVDVKMYNAPLKPYAASQPEGLSF